MSLAEEVRANSNPYRNKREWVRAQLAEQGDDPDELDVLLADAMVPPTEIYRALQRRGIEISEGTIHKWATRARADVPA